MKIGRIILIVVLMAGIFIGGGALIKSCAGKSTIIGNQISNTVQPPAEASFEVRSPSLIYYAKHAIKENNIVVMTDYWAWNGKKWIFYSGTKILSERALGGIIIMAKPK